MRMMKKNALLVSIMLSLTTLMGMGANAQDGVNEELSGKVVVWDWDINRIGAQLEQFNEVYPNIEVEIVPVADTHEYYTKLISAIATGTELPDVGCLEINYRYELLNLGIWEDLTQTPYNVKSEELVDYTIKLNSDVNGKMVALEGTLCPAGLAYKKDLAEKYLGTSDPQELEAMLPDWETFLEVGKKIKAENPDIYLMASADEDVWFPIFNQGTDSLMAEDSSMNKDVLKQVAHYCYNFVKEGICDKMLGYSTAWYNMFADTENYIFVSCANWSPQYNIEPSDENNAGRWGFMTAPGGAFSSGGTSLAVCSESEEKDAAWALINWMLLTEEGGNACKNNIGYYPPLKSLYENPEFITYKTSCFGEQNVGEIWYGKLSNEMNVRTLSEYDMAVTKGKTAWIGLLAADVDSMTEEEWFDRLIVEIEAYLN